MAPGQGMDRRQVLQGIASTALVASCAPRAEAPRASVGAAGGGVAPEVSVGERSESLGRVRMPTGFVAHGAPTLALDPVKGSDLQRWSAAMPRPTAILVVSAHWEAAPLTIGTLDRGNLLYDFYGFPRPLYEVRYDAPGAPELAKRVRSLLGARDVRTENRPLDHGVWVPLIHMASDATVPVLQVSMPTSTGPRALFELGLKLAPLRDEGVLILGSGNVVHNLRRVDWSPTPSTPSWASEYDAWIRETVGSRDHDGLIDYASRSPGLALAHPTHEHLLPLLVAAGAGSDSSATFPVEGFEFGSISRRCVQFG